MTTMQEYWAAVTQVVPVIALALILEARSLAAKWSLNTPTWLRITQTTIWVLPLLAFTFIETQALRALRGASTEIAPWFVELSVGMALGALIGAPALHLLTIGHADWIPWVIYLHPLFRLRCARMRWETKSLYRSIQRSKASGVRKIDETLAQAADQELQWAAISAEHPDVPMPNALVEVRRHSGELRERREQWTQEAEEAARRSAERNQRIDDLLTRYGQANAMERQRLRAILLTIERVPETTDRADD